MTLFEQLQRLEQLDQLIRLKATGRPPALARRLHVSERTVYYLIDMLRSFGAEIYYNADRGSYCYPESQEVEIRFTIRVHECASIKGGLNEYLFCTANFLQPAVPHLCM